VREHTRLYADTDLAERTRAAGGPGDPLRFFFAAGLSFHPPLAPVVGVASALPTVAREARRAFAEDLRARGVADVERTNRERARTETGDRVRLTGYRGTVRIGDRDVPAAGWVGVWATGGAVRVAGGGYPEAPVPGVDHDPAGDRRALLGLVRAVR
jgi:hypothetical protein